MYIIAENLHIISPRFKQAIQDKDEAYLKDMAVKMIDAGAQAIDLNIGLLCGMSSPCIILGDT